MTDDQLDLIFKALSDSTRRRIIDHLSKRPAQALFEFCAASAAEDGIDSRDSHNIPLNPKGTAFQKKVWDALCAIPTGRTVTYSTIAREIGEAKAVRAVANACGASPVAVVVPCQRVLRSDGGIGGYRWCVERKRQLLAKEATA